MIHRLPKIVRFGLILVTTALLGACSSGPGGTTPKPTPDPDPPAQPLNWADVLAEHQVEEATYVIGYQVADGSFIQAGSGFAAHWDDAIWTNAHVADVLVEWMEADAHLKPVALAVQSGTVVGDIGTYRLQAPYDKHPEYDPDTLVSDVASINIDGKVPVTLALLAREHVTKLQVGQPIGLMGFPGELRDDYHHAPIATFKDGTISALRPYTLDAPTPANTKIVQHNLHISGGVSGSAIIDHQGYVIAVNNAHVIATVVDDETGEIEQVSRGLIDYAIRVDEVWAMVDMFSSSAKRVAASSREPLAVYQPFPENWNGTTVAPIR